MAAKGVWNKINTLKLIQLYEVYPLLYDPKNVDYMNNNHRSVALQEIADKLKPTIPTITSQMVKDRIVNIRSQYTSELKRVKASKRSVAGTEEVEAVVEKLWYGFELMSFLEPHVQMRNATSNIKVQELEASRTKNDDPSFEPNSRVNVEDIPREEGEETDEEITAGTSGNNFDEDTDSDVVQTPEPVKTLSKGKHTPGKTRKKTSLKTVASSTTTSETPLSEPTPPKRVRKSSASTAQTMSGNAQALLTVAENLLNKERKDEKSESQLHAFLYQQYQEQQKLNNDPDYKFGLEVVDRLKEIEDPQTRKVLQMNIRKMIHKRLELQLLESTQLSMQNLIDLDSESTTN